MPTKKSFFNILLFALLTFAFVVSLASADTACILTPKPSDAPQINGPEVFGVRPQNPFLFTIPATGKRPMRFSVQNLPKGLSIEENTGHITGSIEQEGDCNVTLQAGNEMGTAKKTLKIKVGDTIALTPPMGWNSWNCWGCAVDDQKIRAAADAMVSTGLINHGWSYINIDDCWQCGENKREPDTGEIQTNEKFPDMKALCDYVHSKGLKIGLYTDCGTMTCGGYEGSKGHESQDIMTYAKWGFDYVKIDWCHTEGMQPRRAYKKFGDAIGKAPRDIVFSICNWGEQKPWMWGKSLGGNLWRTTGDITDTWDSMSGIGFSQDELYKFAKPGHWNDPDMLVVGRVGWGPNLHQTKLTPDEQYTHISLWCLLSSPLLLGCDLTQLDDFTMNLLTNDEVLAINQDRLGKGAKPVVINQLPGGESTQIWVKYLQDGAKAVGLFNLTDEKKQVYVNWERLDIKGKHKVRDLWRQKDLGLFERSFKTEVNPHGVEMIKISAQSG